MKIIYFAQILFITIKALEKIKIIVIYFCTALAEFLNIQYTITIYYK